MEEKKGSWKRKLLLIFVLLVTAGLVILPFVLDRMSEKTGDGASLVSAEVKRADLSRTISGAGTVGAKDAVSVTIPSDVVITGYAVKDGAVVYAGDPVAFVDTVSVYKLIASLGEELDKITEQIAEVQNTWASNYISSNVAGTVTAVYAREGDDIRSVMAEHGALAEITLENGTVLKVSETSGTVLTCFIAEGDEVFVNASLFSVSDVATMNEYGALVLRHQKIEDQLAQLFQMYRDGYVPAPADGMIADTDETLVKKLAAADTEWAGLDFLVYRQSEDEAACGYESLAYGDTVVVTEYTTSQIVEGPNAGGEGVISGVYGGVDLSNFPGAKAGDTAFMREDSTYVTGADGRYYLAGIEYEVLLVESKKDDEQSGSSQSGGKTGSGNGSGTGTGTGSAKSSGTGSTTSVSTSEETVDLSTKTIASVIPMDEALISVSIDELDILTLHVGDKAQVTIDALPGRAFDGVVTAVNTGRSNSGGNSKYIAEVTVKRTVDMFDGMNASCLVTIETLRDVLSIPAAALCDEGGTRLVYTALSRDKSELSEPVPVEYGFSDGETLEILSGLQEGDTVWYKIYDTPEYSVPKSRSSGGLGSLLGGRNQRPRM